VLSQSQQQGSSRRFGCGAMAGGPSNGLFGGAEGALELSGAGLGSWDAPACSSSMLLREFQEPAGNIPAAAVPPVESGVSVGQEEATAVAPVARRKRRRMRTVKNKEEVESQRMTHIAVERNRRKQMNEYLAVLRSLMPPAYAQRVNPRVPRSHARPPRNQSIWHDANSVRARVASPYVCAGRPGVHRRRRDQLRQGAGAAAPVPGGAEAAFRAAPWHRRRRRRRGAVRGLLHLPAVLDARRRGAGARNRRRYNPPRRRRGGRGRVRVEAVGGGGRGGDHGGEPRQPAGAVPAAAEAAAAAGGGAAGPPPHRAPPQHEQRRPDGALLVQPQGNPTFFFLNLLVRYPADTHRSHSKVYSTHTWFAIPHLEVWEASWRLGFRAFLGLALSPAATNSRAGLFTLILLQIRGCGSSHDVRLVSAGRGRLPAYLCG
jgi:hypothetical protein